MFVLLLIALAACDGSAIAPDADKAARAYLRALDHDDVSAAAAIGTTQTADPALFAKLRTVSEPASDDLKFLYATWTQKLGEGAKRRTNIYYERPRGDAWLRIEFAVDGVGDEARVIGVSLTPATQSVADQNRLKLSFAETPLLSLAMGACALAAFGVTIWALVASFVTPPARRRWLWRVCIVLGVCTVTTVWNAGRVSFTPLAVNLFGAGLSRTGLAPWTLEWSIPLAAILFLVRRRRLTQRPAETQEPT